MTTYSVELNEYQVSVIVKALEIYARLSSGQVSIALDEAYGFKISYDNGKDIERMVKSEVFKELSPFSYYGVGNKNYPIIGDCWSMVEVMRYRLAWDNPEKKNTEFDVRYDKPMNWSEHPQIKIEEVK